MVDTMKRLIPAVLLIIAGLPLVVFAVDYGKLGNKAYRNSEHGKAIIYYQKSLTIKLKKTRS